MPITNYSYTDSLNRRIQQLEDTIQKFMTENTILRDMYMELWNNLIDARVKLDNGKHELYENTIDDLKEENEKLNEENDSLSKYAIELEDENMKLKETIDILNSSKKKTK